MTEKIFLNDGLVDADKAYVSARDSGFLYGAGLFETMRSCNGVVFKLDDHLDRLFGSAETLSIKNSYGRKYISEAIYKTLEANELKDARLRLTLTGGVVSASEEETKSTLLVTAAQFQSYPAEYYKNGVLVVICPYKQSTTEIICGHKTTSYFSRMLGLDLARSKRAAEALWFTVDNQLAEGCISNVFVVKDSVLYTPKLATPVLAGIARKTICQIASKNSIKLVEKDLYISDVLDADEAFLTNVIMQIMPISRVEKHEVGQGKVGLMTKKLQKFFDEVIEKECTKSR